MSKDVCLDGIGIGLTNGKESPICQYRKNDAKDVEKFMIDPSKDIATIRLKVWDRSTEPQESERLDTHQIHAIQLLDSGSNLICDSQYDQAGDWMEHQLQAGDKIIGIYGYLSKLTGVV